MKPMGAEIKRREHAERPVRQRSSTLIEADEEIDGTWWRMRRRSSARGLRESFVLVAISVIFFHPGSSWAQGPLEVQWKGGRLSVRTGKAELSKVVEEIASQLGIEVQSLEEESQRQELAAIGAAAATGDQAALREALLSPDPTVATVAFQNLTELDPAVAEEAIASAAKSDQPVTRLKALRLLDQVSQADEGKVLSGLGA